MMNLTTRYLGLGLRSPLVASAGPLTSTAEGIQELADAGLDLGIVYLPPPHSPADLETVAEAVAGI